MEDGQRKEEGWEWGGGDRSIPELLFPVAVRACFLFRVYFLFT